MTCIAVDSASKAVVMRSLCMILPFLGVMGVVREPIGGCTTHRYSEPAPVTS